MTHVISYPAPILLQLDGLCYQLSCLQDRVQNGEFSKELLDAIQLRLAAVEYHVESCSTAVKDRFI